MNILIKPIITEKAMRDAAVGRFTFMVQKMATKYMIADETATMFKVHPVSVKTTIVKGRRVRVGKRRQEREAAAWKKAVIELKNGEKIGLFDIQGGEAHA